MKSSGASPLSRRSNMSASGRASSSTSTSRSSGASRAAPASVSRRAQARQPPHRRGRRSPPGGGLGMRAHRDRRRHASGLRPKCSPRDRRDGGPLEPAAAFFARHAINVKLPTDKGPAYVWVARDRVPFARRSPSTDSPAPTPHQRQGLCLKTTGRRSWRRGSPRSDSGEGTPEIEIPEPFWLRELFS
jgi:hypothetical protein